MMKGNVKMPYIRPNVDTPNLAEMLDRILDNGIVIDAWIRIHVIGIDLIAIEARVVIASIESYLNYARAIGLLQPLPETNLLQAGQEPPVRGRRRERAGKSVE
jgi:gas vesicle structural protein